MKIAKKLMLSNILITLITMVVLTMIISNIVSNYIEEDIKEDIIKENNILTEWLSYNKFLKYEKSKLYVYLSDYGKKNKLPTISIVFNLDENGELLDASPYKMGEELTKSDISYMLTQDLKDVYSLGINGKPHLAYNDSVKVKFEGNVYNLMIATLLPNELINEISRGINQTLIFAIVVTSVFLIVLTRYNERMITNPIKILVNATEKIGNKNFDKKADLQTEDEFEVLGSAINEMAESLRKQDIEQKKFYENLSHEIKTPLTVISGYAQGIKTNIFEDSNKALDIIVEESNRLKKQLENVIYLSKLDTVNDSYKLEEASLNDLISNALQKLDSVIIINDIDIIFEPKFDIELLVDKEKISRAFINIFSNCIKYTQDTIYINIEKIGGFAKIEISDNGNGFSENLLENPFNRTIIGEKEGSGIGLSIIKKILDGHNGKITLSNKHKSGAVYTVMLPISLKENVAK